MRVSVCDLCDLHEESVQVAEPLFTDYGGATTFTGEVFTVRCFEDNSKVKVRVAEPGQGRVMVVDGGASIRRSLLGDQLAAKAADNGWAGFVINGAVRDIEIMETLNVGVKALNVIPLKTQKRGLGETQVPLRFAGVDFVPGHFLYADTNGVIVSANKLV
ncbi:MAG: ribonuclease E activity regulator RraA [Gammaproteobacteria bacterium]